ncbi:MAG: hypothetical protein V1756_00705 [Patescibacteria group bacterium]
MIAETPNYISLQDAAKICDYSQEYLALRIRQGKLKGKKMGRNWVTRKEWLDDYLKGSENYISLLEAAKHCNYSQEYLSLRARRGKLKSVKLGRNWVTKKEWLNEYLKVANGFGNRRKKGTSHQNFPVVQNLLVVPHDFSFFSFRKNRFAVLLSLLVLLFCGTIFIKIPINNISSDSQLATIGMQEIFQNTVSVFGEYWQWVTEEVDNRLVNIKNHFLSIINLFNGKESEENNEGLVVVPSAEVDEELKEKIKVSFSDEVKVEPQDEKSGIIIPIFKTGEGEKYFYMLVPVKNN